MIASAFVLICIFCVLQWLTAFLMLAFYLFLATVLFSLPAVGWGHNRLAVDVSFALNAARVCFGIASVVFGVSIFLHGAHVIFSHSDYGLWVGGGIGAGVAFIAFLVVSWRAMTS